MHFKKIALKYFIVFALISITLEGQSQHNDKVVKAVFFERFARFIEWKSTNNSNTDHFVIGVIGEDAELYNQLKRVYSQHNIQDLPTKVIQFKSIEELEKSNCHILFISKDLAENLPIILYIAKTKGILTIGDTKNYDKKGVVINFFLKNNSIHFNINQGAAKDADLYISYHLLRMADEIIGI